MGTSRVSYLFTYYATPGWNYNLIQCTGTIDSGNIAVLSADFKNVIFKNNTLDLNGGQTVLGHCGPSLPSYFGSSKRL